MSATAQRIVAWLREEFDHEDVASAIEDHFCRLDEEDHSDDGFMDRRGDPDRLGERLRSGRERRGIGLRQAAEETGVSFNTLSRIERGHDCRYSHALAILAWLTVASREAPESEGRDEPV